VATGRSGGRLRVLSNGGGGWLYALGALAWAGLRNSLAGLGSSRSCTSMATPTAPTTVSSRSARELAAELAALIGERAVPPLLDAGQAAAILNVPRSWVAAEARAGRIPHVRLGRYVRFNRDELVAWFEGRAVGPRRRGGRTE
jgi:excisionase family DNA binding protein